MAEEAKDAFWTSRRMAGNNGLYSTLVANCFFNAFLLFTAMVLNIITIQALRKISSFPKPLKTLLLSLAVSDLGVGLLVHPLHIVLLVMNMEQNTNNRIYIMVYKANLISTYLLCAASFLSIIALTVDRFLAIHLHLRYQEFVTHKRVVTVVISVWVWCSCVSLFALNRVLENVLAIINATILNCTSPHKSDSRPAIATCRTESECRIGKCCKTEKNGTCYILCVGGVCGLFFALYMRYSSLSNLW